MAKRATVALTEEEQEHCMAAAAADYAAIIPALRAALDATSTLNPDQSLHATYQLHALLKKATPISARRLRFYDRTRNYGGRGPLAPSASLRGGQASQVASIGRKLAS